MSEPGRQHAAAVAAGGDDRHALGFRRVLRGIEVLGRELVQHADDLVLHEAQPLGAAPPVPVLDQQVLGRGASLHQRGLDAAGDREAQFARVAGRGPWPGARGRPRRRSRRRLRFQGGHDRWGSACCHRIAEHRRCVTGCGTAGARRGRGNVLRSRGRNGRNSSFDDQYTTDIFSLTLLLAVPKNKHSADLSTAACGRFNKCS